MRQARPRLRVTHHAVRHPRQQSARLQRRRRVIIMKLSNIPMAMSWALQLIVAGILLETLFFKFTGAAESVSIFSTLCAEPWGRIGSGVVELVAALLLLYPATI